MLHIFWRTIKDRKWTLLIYSLAAIIFLWMYVALFPTVQAQAKEAVSAVIKSLPKGLTKAFGLDPESFITFEGLVAGKHFSLIWPMMLIGLAVSLGSSFISEEVEKGTIDVLLSQPVSRSKIFFSKFLAGIFDITIFVFVSVLSVFPLAKLHNISYNADSFLEIAVVGLFLGLAIFGLSMLSSAVFSEKGRAIFATSGILIVMYFINIIALLKESLDKIKYFSLFYYFNYNDILVHNKVDHWSWWVFIGTFLVSSLAALVWFNKRDISV